jgi:hypothetical protein
MAVDRDMDRSMHLRHLEQAERHVWRGEQNILDQEQHIQSLERRGQDTALAREVLDTFVCTQTLFLAHRDQVLRELGEPDPVI